MNCQHIEFSPEKSEERFDIALRVFHPKVLYRIIAFVLYILGAKRRDVARTMNMPLDSVKTTVRVINQDGFPALRDRRRSDNYFRPKLSKALPQISVRQDDDYCVVEFCEKGDLKMKILLSHQMQVRTILLSLLNARLISTKETAAVLGICEAYCRELAGKLDRDDIPDSLLDKRRGQKSDYRVGAGEKAEIIKQFAARAVTGHSTSSEILAERVSESTQTTVSSRTIRWHMNKLGLKHIKHSLPALVDSLKKTVNDST